MGTKYSANTIVGFNANAPADDGTQVDSNKMEWQKHLDKIGTPVKDLAEAINTGLLAHVDESVVNKSAIFTTTVAEHKRTINVTTASDTVSLGDAATMGAGYIVTVKNSHTAANTVDLDTAADTLDGVANGTVSIAPNNQITFATNQAADGYFMSIGMSATAVGGLILAGQGSTYDVSIRNDADAFVTGVPTGTTTLVGKNGDEIYGQFAVKASDESVTSSTTLQDDDDLTATLAASGIYQIELMLIFTSASDTPEAKFSLIEADGTWNSVWTKLATGGGTVESLNESSSASVILMDSAVVYEQRLSVVAIAGGAGGVFKLQWAQNVSNGTATVLKKGSWMRTTKLS